jgi:hypothetical protein
MANIQGVVRADFQHYLTNYAFFNRNSARFTLGLSWSPGDIPLTLW